MRAAWSIVLAVAAGSGALRAQAPAANSPAAAPPPLIWRYGPVTQAPLPVGQYYHDWNAAWAGGHGWLPQTPDGRFAAGGAAVYGAARPTSPPQPSYGPALVLQPAAAPPVAPVKPKPPAPVAEKKQPFTAVSGRGPGGAGWTEYDLAEYTSRFAPADRPEEGVRRWLLAETGEVWNDAELAGLSVNAERVKAYHTPAVQRQVAATVGRFVHFSPGQFRCRVRVLQARDDSWRRNHPAATQAQAAGGGQAWRLPAAQVEDFVEDTGRGAGNALLWEQTFLAPNGQRTLVEMTAGGVREAGAGVALRFSPLIADDLGVDIEFDAVGRKAAPAKPLGGEAPDDWKSAANGRLRLLAGQALAISLGRGPGLDQRIRLLNPRPETLLVLEIAPETGSTLAGRPLPAPPQALRDPSPGGETPAARRALSPRRRAEQRHNELSGLPFR